MCTEIFKYLMCTELVDNIFVKKRIFFKEVGTRAEIEDVTKVLLDVVQQYLVLNDVSI